MRISNDLRWMNSGPLAGLAKIELEAEASAGLVLGFCLMMVLDTTLA